MPPYPHLRNAPITEAILDVRVRARPDLQLSELKRAAQTLGPGFEKVQEQRGFQATLQLTNEGVQVAPGPITGSVGYRAMSGDEKDIVQYRIDGFTLNRLKPYSSWDVWFPKFMRLWDAYRMVARPDGISQVGVRCINHIPLPTPIGQPIDFAMYLEAPPAAPQGVSLPIRGFVTQLALSASSEPSTTVHLSQALQTGSAGEPQLMIDVDAFRPGDIDQTQLTQVFEELHDLRNAAFFKSITPLTVSLCQ